MPTINSSPILYNKAILTPITLANETQILYSLISNKNKIETVYRLDDMDEHFVKTTLPLLYLSFKQIIKSTLIENKLDTSQENINSILGCDTLEDFRYKFYYDSQSKIINHIQNYLIKHQPFCNIDITQIKNLILAKYSENYKSKSQIYSNLIHVLKTIDDTANEFKDSFNYITGIISNNTQDNLDGIKFQLEEVIPNNNFYGRAKEVALEYGKPLADYFYNAFEVITRTKLKDNEKNINHSFIIYSGDREEDMELAANLKKQSINIIGIFNDIGNLIQRADVQEKIKQISQDIPVLVIPRQQDVEENIKIYGLLQQQILEQVYVYNKEL